jgi:hypothetical protein
MPQRLQRLQRQRRREAEREFLQLLIATGHTLAAHAPDPEKRQAATRVTRRLRLLLLLL